MGVSSAQNIKISLQDIVKFLPAHVYWLNKEMKFLGCNDAQAKMSGLSSCSEVVGKSIYDFTTKHCGDSIIKNNNLVLSQKKHFTFEEVALLPDGSQEIYLSEKSPLFNNHGEIIGLLGVSFNVTEKKQAEENKDILLEEIISRLPGNVYWKNRKGSYQGCNFNTAKIIKFSSLKDIIGKTIYDLHPDNFKIAKSISEEDEKIMQSNQSKTFEEKGLDANRKKAVYLTNKVPLSNRQGQVIGLLGLSFDITARKKAEQKLRKTLQKLKIANAIKSELLSIVSTSLRTPLNNIIGMLDLLKQTSMKSEQQTYIEKAQKSILSIAPLLGHIQDYLNIESGKARFLQEEFAVKAIIENMMRQYVSEAYAKNLDLLIDFRPNFPDVIITDSSRFSQILEIFFSNAIKYTSSGHIILSGEMLEDVQKIKISVKDTGEGLSKEKQAYLFNLFTEPKNKLKSYRHAGLRLSICRQLLRFQGGDAGVIGEQGKGSAFWLTLPLTLPAAQQLKTFKPQSRQTPDLRNVLIVDDNLVRANIIADYFTYQKMPFVKGSDALEMLLKAAKNNQVFEAVLIDQELSSVNLVSLVRQINDRPELNKIVVIVLAYPDFEEKFQSFFIGCDQVLTLQKPLYPSFFLSEISKIYHSYQKLSPDVLLVEDNLINQKVLQDLLEKLGCSVDAVTHGFHAMRKIHERENPYDIVFMDINLPDKSGAAVTAEIKSQIHYENVPVVGVTAYTAEEEVEKMLEAGASQVVFKPVGIDIFRKILRYYLQRPAFH